MEFQTSILQSLTFLRTILLLLQYELVNKSTNKSRLRRHIGFTENFREANLVPRVLSLSNTAAAGEKTLAHSRNHVTDLSTESGNLFKMAAKIKSERIWVRGLETGEKQTKWRQRQTQKKLKI